MLAESVLVPPFPLLLATVTIFTRGALPAGITNFIILSSRCVVSGLWAPRCVPFALQAGFSFVIQSTEATII